MSLVEALLHRQLQELAAQKETARLAAKEARKKEKTALKRRARLMKAGPGVLLQLIATLAGCEALELSRPPPAS